MDAPIFLKTFTHTILPSPVVVSKGTNEGNNQFDHLTPSLSADIDFENGSFKIEGDWHFMMTCNKHVQPEWFNYHTQRVNVSGSIYPSFTIDLNDRNNDGTVFILEGNITDNENNSNGCSGLLVLDRAFHNSKQADSTWTISMYLYDNTNEDCEIAFKIPVFISRSDTKFN